MGGYQHDTTAFRQAIYQVNNMGVDFAVICGDLVNHASDSSFTDLQGLLDAFQIPFYLVAGNHDVGLVPNDSSLAYYRRTFGEDYYQLRHKGTSFVFVNTQLWKADIGEESSKHHLWFKEAIEKSGKKDRIVVVGHYPLYISDLLEEEVYSNLPLDKRTELMNLFTENGVVAYLSGHRHELVINDHKGIQLVSGETTSKNFDKRPLGFRKWDVEHDTLTHEFIQLHLD
jgi:3',5'-cyclic AMP phosphodiesterase CpdA